MSGWATLGAALGGANNGMRQQMLFNQGAEQGARMENLLGEARRRRDENLAFQSITPQSIQAAMSTADPITGQPYTPEAANAIQGTLVSSLLHAGINPQQFSGYLKDQQGIGFRNSAMKAATDPNTSLDSLNRRMIVIGDKPVELTKVEGNAVLNPYATPDSQTVKMTDLGQAMAGAQGALVGKYNADAGAANALTGERNAHARLFDKQTSVVGFNPNTGSGHLVYANGASLDASDPLAGLSPADASLVKKIAHYEVLPSSLGRSQGRQELIARATLLNPDYNEAGAKQAYTYLQDLGKSGSTSAGGQVQAINTGLNHLGTLMRANGDLAGTSYQPLNSLINYMSEKTGGTAAPNWDQATQLFSQEMAKLVKGGVANEGEMRDIMNHLSASKSPEQRAQAIQQAAEFMYGRIQAVQDRGDRVLGGMAPESSLMTQEAEDNLRAAYKLGGRIAPDLRPAKDGSAYVRQSAGASPTPPAQLATPTTQAQFNALPSGALYIDPDDGKTYRKP